MTKREAKKIIQSCKEGEGPSEDVAREIFLALYGREPDEWDEREGVWSHCCAYYPD